MSSRSRFVPLFLFLLLPAVLLADESVPPADDEGAPGGSRMQPDHAPTPYSAEEIQAGCPAGRKITLRVERREGTAMRMVMHFVASDAERHVVESSVFDEEGNALGAPRRSEGRWAGLQKHASFPEAQTKISTVSAETPLGTLDCWLYEVTRGEGERQVLHKYWFDKMRPGPPVLMEIHQGGERQSRTVMTADERTTAETGSE